MTEEKTIVFEYCDATVSVYAVDRAYHVDEERELITEIPFFNSDYDNKEQFMLKVQKVVNKLADAYTHFDRLVTIETTFINRYCNES
jgi:hypothetical protein